MGYLYLSLVHDPDNKHATLLLSYIPTRTCAFRRGTLSLCQHPHVQRLHKLSPLVKWGPAMRLAQTPCADSLNSLLPVPLRRMRSSAVSALLAMGDGPCIEGKQTTSPLLLEAVPPDIGTVHATDRLL